MTDEPPPLRSLENGHREAINDVNRWRGYCTDKFARIDEAVATALEALAAKDPKENVRTSHLFGPRIAALRAALQSDRRFAAKAAPVLKALSKLEPLLAQRNILVHATGSVWIDAKGRWLWRYCVTPSGRNRVQEKGTMDRDEAAALEKQLGPLCRSFCDRVRHFAATDGQQATRPSRAVDPVRCAAGRPGLRRLFALLPDCFAIARLGSAA